MQPAVFEKAQGRASRQGRVHPFQDMFEHNYSTIIIFTPLFLLKTAQDIIRNDNSVAKLQLLQAVHYQKQKPKLYH